MGVGRGAIFETQDHVHVCSLNIRREGAPGPPPPPRFPPSNISTSYLCNVGFKSLAFKFKYTYF